MPANIQIPTQGSVVFHTRHEFDVNERNPLSTSLLTATPTKAVQCIVAVNGLQCWWQPLPTTVMSL